MSNFSDPMMFRCSPMASYNWKNANVAEEVAPNCPRCASSNTKFCYYNNYSLLQPRYFCKGCRRYWTKGGSLRNVPVGGGCRKSRRSQAAHPTIHRTDHSVTSRFGGDQHNYGQFGSPNSDSSTINSDGCEIDMALVFAKYLNQDSCSREELCDEVIETSASSNSVNQDYERPENHAAIECQEYPVTDLIGESNSTEQVVPRQEISAEKHEFGLLGMVEEVPQDALWSNDGIALPQYTWQSFVQLQDFDAFQDDIHDQFLKIPTNLNSDGWSSLNL